MWKGMVTNMSDFNNKDYEDELREEELEMEDVSEEDYEEDECDEAYDDEDSEESDDLTSKDKTLDGTKSDREDSTKESEYEDVCFICRRPESKTGKMFKLPNHISVCNDCMHKTMDTVSQFDYQGCLAIRTGTQSGIS